MNVEYVIDKVEKKPIIYIFDREGRKRKIKVIEDFKPYFYIKKEEEGKARELGLEVESKIYRGIFGEELVKVFCKLPTDVRELREKFKESWEADVLFVDRWMIDCLKEVERKEWRVCFLDIECDDETFPLPTNPINSIYSISIYDNYTQKYASFIWKNGESKIEVLKFSKNNIEFNVKVFWFDCEEKMLESFVKFMKDLDFDILVGWNVMRFDLLYLIERMKRLNINYNSLSPLNEVFTDLKYGEVRIRGRSVIDLLSTYKLQQVVERKSYNLDYVGKLELKYGKFFDNIEEEYQTTVKERVRKLWMYNPTELIKYNIWDVYLCVKLDEKLGLLNLIFDRSLIVGCRWEDSLTPSKIIDVLLLRYGKECGVVFPTKTHKRGERYKGAIVFNPLPGLHKNVACMDFKSLYPSIIMTFNISPENLTSSNNNIVVGNGVCFSNERRGVIPSLFDRLMELREYYKKIRDGYEKGSSEWKVYDNKQTITKYLINAIYGVLGYPNFRLFNSKCAESVTFIERKIILKLGELVRKEGYDVVYGDTDSIFVKKEGVGVEEYKKLNERLNEEIKKWILGSEFGNLNPQYYRIYLDLKNIYSSIFFTSAKKRYVGKIVWSDGKLLSSPLTEVVGFEAKRSDTSDFCEKLQKNIFEMILSGKGEEDVVSYVKNEIENVRSGKYKYEEIAIPKGVRKNFLSYKSNNPYVRAVNYSNKYLGTNFQPGDKIKLVWIRRVKGKYPPTDVVAFYDGFFIPLEFEVDWDRMIEINITNKLKNLLEGFPINLNLLTSQKPISEFL